VTLPGAVVVKLGGSYAFSARLRPWVEALRLGPRRLVLVPGGGPFADAVRSAQPRMGFDDGAADGMALLAMAQFGLALESLFPFLAVASGPAAFAQAWTQGRVPVWAPMTMLAEAPARPTNWDVTSDSLALWLAARIGAHAALLVKHAAVRGDVGALVDRSFPRFRAAFGGPVHLAGPDDVPRAGWSEDALPGIAFELVAS
jgi:aspartokinase-like uncharacterized kinase